MRAALKSYSSPAPSTTMLTQKFFSPKETLSGTAYPESIAAKA
jgi:hypothetical protein